MSVKLGSHIKAGSEVVFENKVLMRIFGPEKDKVTKD
jgi:hypothetical protein